MNSSICVCSELVGQSSSNLVLEVDLGSFEEKQLDNSGITNITSPMEWRRKPLDAENHQC
jgi:hypothetical protein